MDKAALQNLCSTSEAFAAMSRREQREETSTVIRAAISALVQEGCEPDDWESHQLAQACGAMAEGGFERAINHVLLAAEPAHARAVTSELDKLRTVSELRDLEVLAYRVTPI